MDADRMTDGTDGWLVATADDHFQLWADMPRPGAVRYQATWTPMSHDRAATYGEGSSPTLAMAQAGFPPEAVDAFNAVLPWMLDRPAPRSLEVEDGPAL